MSELSERRGNALTDLIRYAGGLSVNAYPEYVQIQRYIDGEELLMEWNLKEVRNGKVKVPLINGDVIRIRSINKPMDQYVGIQGDKLNIYDNTTYSNIGEIRIFGAVNNPKGYTFNPSMTIHDLIVNSGGFTVGAAYNRVEVFRTTLSPTEKVKLQLLTLEVDSNYNIVDPVNFVLQPYDQVVVRMTPEFTLGRTIEITGQVEYPGTYVLESKQTRLSEILESAGGLLKDADPYGAQLFRTFNNRGSISMDLKRVNLHAGNSAYDPILFEGDVININRLENVVSILQNGTRMAQYSNDTSLINDTTISKVLKVETKNVVFQGRRSAAWYIHNFAGGFQKNADRNSVTVTLPNNQMVSTKHFLFFRDYPTVESGSTISLQMDTNKMEKELEPREKVDWERTLQTGLSTLMSTLSIILLLENL